jgi:hypothetical protein
MRTLLCSGLLLLGLVPSAAAGPTDSGVCSLLTRDEAAAALGAAVTEIKPLPGGPAGAQGIDVSACAYKAGTKDITVSLWRFAPSAQQSLTVYRGLCKQKEQAAGIGDLACWYNARHSELQVVKGTALLIFEMNGGADKLVTAAKQAVVRLR